MRGLLGRAALLLVLAGACSSIRPSVPPFREAPPKTIAVLPLEGDLAPRGRAIVRRLVGGLLADRGYVRIDDEIVDAELAAAGLAPWNSRWVPDDTTLASLARRLGAGALLVGEDFQDSSLQAGVFYRRGLSGRFRWFDGASGATLWSTEVGRSTTGGVALQSGQVLKALSETVASGSEDRFVRLAAAIALDFTDAVPAHPSATELGERPTVESVRFVAERRALVAGDMLDLEARGTPGGRARADLAGLAMELPLAETSPGTYRARARIDAGMGVAGGPVTVTIYDRFGRASAPRSSAESLAIDAPRLDPPSEVVVESLVARRRLRIRWSESPGAAGYSVARITEGAPESIAVARGAVELEDTVPDPARTVVYAVSAHSASGCFGPPAVSAVVELAP